MKWRESYSSAIRDLHKRSWYSVYIMERVANNIFNLFWYEPILFYPLFIETEVNYKWFLWRCVNVNIKVETYMHMKTPKFKTHFWKKKKKKRSILYIEANLKLVIFIRIIFLILLFCTTILHIWLYLYLYKDMVKRANTKQTESLNRRGPN